MLSVPRLKEYQTQAVKTLLGNRTKRFLISSPGTGKTAIAMRFLAEIDKPKVLFVTTPSVRDSNQIPAEAKMWNGEEWLLSRERFEIVSWSCLARWVEQNRQELETDSNNWVFIADEVAKGKAGVRSQRGKAFLKLTHIIDCWIGMTATPGDSWIDFQAYAVATHLVRNLTEFKRRYCLIATYRGFEDITGYQREDELDMWWKQVSYQLDQNLLAKELPPRVHHIVQFPTPNDYKKTVKTSIAPDGIFLDTASAMRHWCRQACATAKARRTWVSDFIESVPEPIVFFTNYNCEDEMIAEAHKKAYPKAKIWFINGGVHNIPTAETIGNHDIVVAKYPSACEGLNLQFIHYCVLVSPNDSYSVSNQVRGRIRRHGQTMPQQYYYLQAKGTVEMAIYKALKNKSDFNWDRWKPTDDLK